MGIAALTFVPVGGALPGRRADLAAGLERGRGRRSRWRASASRSASSRWRSPAMFALDTIAAAGGQQRGRLPRPAGAAVRRRQPRCTCQPNEVETYAGLVDLLAPATAAPPSSATPTSTASISGRGSKPRRRPPRTPGSRRSTAASSSVWSTSCGPRRVPARSAAKRARDAWLNGTLAARPAARPLHLRTTSARSHRSANSSSCCRRRCFGERAAAGGTADSRPDHRRGRLRRLQPRRLARLPAPRLGDRRARQPLPARLGTEPAAAARRPGSSSSAATSASPQTSAAAAARSRP